MNSKPACSGLKSEEIYGERDKYGLDHLPPIANVQDHVVLFKVSTTTKSIRPEPYEGENK